MRLLPDVQDLASLDLPNRIHTARRALGLSQQHAATRAGLTTRTWSSVEAGESVRLDTLTAVLEVVGLGLAFELVELARDEGEALEPRAAS